MVHSFLFFYYTPPIALYLKGVSCRNISLDLILNIFADTICLLKSVLRLLIFHIYVMICLDLGVSFYYWPQLSFKCSLLALDKHTEIHTLHHLLVNALNFDELQNLMCLKLWNLLPSCCSKNLGILERILRNREPRFIELVLAAKSLMHIITIHLCHSAFCVHYFLMLEKRKGLLSKVTSLSQVARPNSGFFV